MRYSTIFLFSVLFIACNFFESRSRKVFTKDKDYYEINRKYSPDSSKFILVYGLDQGATGQGEVGAAILRHTDTLNDISPFTIPWDIYQEVIWQGNDSVLVYLDYLKRMRQGASTRIYYDTVSINGIPIKYDLKEPIDSSYKTDTLFNEISPNGEYRAIVYRYTKPWVKENFLNISVISPNGLLPKYGNYFISDMKNDYVYNIEWTSDNKLTFYTTSSTQYIIDSYLVRDRWKVPYEIKVDDASHGTTFRSSKKNAY